MDTEQHDRSPLSEIEIYKALAQNMDGWEEWVRLGGGTEFVSPSCQKYTGLSAEALTAAPERLLDFIHPDDRERFLEVRTALLHPTRRETGAATTFRMAQPGSAERWISMSAVPKEKLNGNSSLWEGVRILYTDIDAQKRAEQALSCERRAIQALINTPNDVFTLLDRNGIVLAGNEVMARGLRRPLHEILGKNVFSLYHPNRVEARRAAFDRVLATGKPVRIDDFNATGQFMYDSLIYPVLDDEGQVLQVVILARDVSERHQMVQELSRARDELEARVAERTAELQAANTRLLAEIEMRQKAEEGWRKNASHAEALNRLASRLNAHLNLDTLLQTICRESLAVLSGFSVVMISLYDEGTDLFVPRAIVGTVGQLEDAPPVRFSTFQELMTQEQQPLVVEDVRKVPLTWDMVIVQRLDLCTVVSHTLWSEGKLVGSLAIMSTGTPRLPDEDEIRLIQGLAEHACIAINNAQMYQQSRADQERLRALSDRLIEVREDERRVLANEIHDGFGQSLTVLSLNLDSAARIMQNAKGKLNRATHESEPPPYNTTEAARNAGPVVNTRDENETGETVIEKLRLQVNELLQKARDLSQDLRPGVLDELGLFPALLDYSERYTRQTGVQVNLRQKGALRRYSPRVETTTFRVAQEALMNVAHHAQVAEASLVLWCDQEFLGLRVEDHGVGFETSQLQVASALARVKELAILCEGNLEIESIPGQGTILTLEIPITADQEPGDTSP